MDSNSENISAMATEVNHNEDVEDITSLAKTFMMYKIG